MLAHRCVPEQIEFKGWCTPWRVISLPGAPGGHRAVNSRSLAETRLDGPLVPGPGCLSLREAPEAEVVSVKPEPPAWGAERTSPRPSYFQSCSRSVIT